jgi:hypothetical protein
MKMVIDPHPLRFLVGGKHCAIELSGFLHTRFASKIGTPLFAFLSCVTVGSLLSSLV